MQTVSPRQGIMEMFRRREKEVDRGFHDSEPTFPRDPNWIEKKNRALRDVVEANPSDPYIRARAEMAIDNGLLRPDEVIEDRGRVAPR